ncbi:MAG: hypothetical protein M1816_006838 [Peltula sp. TS41687]|nr:MAG: hypothetical protein M1816_006838 [Peltula sp. TS41687]
MAAIFHVMLALITMITGPVFFLTLVELCYKEYQWRVHGRRVSSPCFRARRTQQNRHRHPHQHRHHHHDHGQHHHNGSPQASAPPPSEVIYPYQHDDSPPEEPAPPPPSPEPYAYPDQPIQVITDVRVLDPEEAMTPPPEYGHWGGTVRADPNLFHWQRVERDELLNRPPTPIFLPPPYVAEV